MRASSILELRDNALYKYIMYLLLPSIENEICNLSANPKITSNILSAGNKRRSEAEMIIASAKPIPVKTRRVIISHSVIDLHDNKFNNENMKYRYII